MRKRDKDRLNESMAVSLENEQIKNENTILRKRLAAALTQGGMTMKKPSENKGIQTDIIKQSIIVPDLTIVKKTPNFEVPQMSQIKGGIKQKLRSYLDNIRRSSPEEGYIKARNP